MTNPTDLQGQLTLVLGPGQTFTLPEGSADIQFDAAASPEPATLLLFAAGLLAFGGLRFKR